MLFIALWTLVILAILAIGISNRVASEIRLAKYLDERTLSLYLSKAALKRAILELEKDKTPDYDTLYELQKKRERKLGNGEFIFNLIDEESLININTASFGIISVLPGLNPELAKSIYESSLKPFLLKEELLLIEGMTPEIFSEFKDLITVYTEGKVNINTASSGVLRVLGLEEDIIEKILQFRKGEDAEEGTEDDGIYTSIPADIPEILRPLFTVAAKNLRMSILTKVSDQTNYHYSVILERTTGKIKFWGER